METGASVQATDDAKEGHRRLWISEEDRRRGRQLAGGYGTRKWGAAADGILVRQGTALAMAAVSPQESQLGAGVVYQACLPMMTVLAVTGGGVTGASGTQASLPSSRCSLPARAWSSSFSSAPACVMADHT